MDKKVEPKQGFHTVDGRAASKTAEELEKLRHEAHKHLQAKQWHEALTTFNELLQDDQEDVDALLGLALALDRLGDYQKMYEISLSAAQIALALLRMNRMYEALEVVNQSLALDPDFLLALETKGEILRRYARFEEVIVTMDHALQLAPDDVSALNLMANALRTTGQFDRLLEITQRLMLLAPESPLSWDFHISALRGTSRFEEANEVVDHILEFDPTNVRYWMFKADNLYRLQRYREAVSVSEHALKIDDEYPPARRIHEKAMRMMYQKKK